MNDDHQQQEPVDDFQTIHRWLPCMRMMDKKIFVIGQLVKDDTEFNNDTQPIKITTGEILGMDGSIIQDDSDKLYKLIGAPVYIPPYKQEHNVYHPINEDDYKEFLNIWDP